MSKVDECIEKYEIGKEIFNSLFNLSDDEIKEKLISILEPKYTEIFKYGYSCKRIIIDSEPECIEFYFYDTIKINYLGITYIPEHKSDNLIVQFNKNFKL